MTLTFIQATWGAGVDVAEVVWEVLSKCLERGATDESAQMTRINRMLIYRGLDQKICLEARVLLNKPYNRQLMSCSANLLAKYFRQ